MSKPSAVALTLLLLVGSTGCSTHVVGLVTPADPHPVLTTMQGATYKLVARGDAAPLAWLDGHMTEVTGLRFSKRIFVRDWHVNEGLHGLPAWVGTLEQRGVQIGLFDRYSKAYYFVDEAAVGVLQPFVGMPVLVEGYVEGAHRLRVVYFRVLSDEERDTEPGD